MPVLNRRGLRSPATLAMLITLGATELARGALLVAILPTVLDQRLHITSMVTLGWLSGLGLYGADTVLRSPSGWLADHFGPARALAVACAVVFGGTLLVGGAHGLPTLALGVTLIGVGMAPIWTSVIAGVTEAAGPNNRATAMSAIFAAWLCGCGAGTVASTLLLDRLPVGEVGQVMPLIQGSVALALGVASLHLLAGLTHRVRRPTGVRGEREQPRIPAPRVSVGEYVRGLRQTMVRSRALLPAMVLQTLILGIVLAVVQRYGTKVLGATTGQITWLLFAGGGMVVVLLLPIARLVDRYGPRRFLRAGFALAALPMAGLAAVHTLAPAIWLTGLLGAAYAVILSSWNALLARAVPDNQRGGTWGLFMTVEGAGFALGPPVAGILWEMVGPRAPFATAAALLVALAVAYSVFRVDQRLFGR